MKTPGEIPELRDPDRGPGWELWPFETERELKLTLEVIRLHDQAARLEDRIRELRAGRPFEALRLVALGVVVGALLSDVILRLVS